MVTYISYNTKNESIAQLEIVKILNAPKRIPFVYLLDTYYFDISALYFKINYKLFGDWYIFTWITR